MSIIDSCRPSSGTGAWEFHCLRGVAPLTAGKHLKCKEITKSKDTKRGVLHEFFSKLIITLQVTCMCLNMTLSSEKSTWPQGFIQVTHKQWLYNSKFITESSSTILRRATTGRYPKLESFTLIPQEKYNQLIILWELWWNIIISLITTKHQVQKTATNLDGYKNKGKI